MCGRYILLNGVAVWASDEYLKELDREGVSYTILPRYNAAPMIKHMPIIARVDDQLEVLEAQWWLVPAWSKDGKPNMKYSSFNARAEKIDSSALFKQSFFKYRCLIPADGFYEWKKIELEHTVKGKKKKVLEKQPYCIRMKNEKTFFFAGIYSIFKDAEGKEHASYAIITTEPNELMAVIHNRMPVILKPPDFKKWLDPKSDPKELKKLLVPFPADKMKSFRVSKLVNSGKIDDPNCWKPITDEKEL